MQLAFSSHDAHSQHNIEEHKSASIMNNTFDNQSIAEQQVEMVEAHEEAKDQQEVKAPMEDGQSN